MSNDLFWFARKSLLWRVFSSGLVLPFLFTASQKTGYNPEKKFSCTMLHFFSQTGKASAGSGFHGGRLSGLYGAVVIFCEVLHENLN